MRCDERQRAVERFVAERGDRLLRAAALLAGSQAGGEDLLQSALERLLRNWRRIDGDPESYVRRTLYNLAADGWRRQRVWQRKALLLGPTPATDPAAAVDLRDAVVRALLQLPPRQRAVLVLRYFEQLSEAETAEILGCPVGTVKWAASRGLARLREMTVSAPVVHCSPSIRGRFRLASACRSTAQSRRTGSMWRSAPCGRPCGAPAAELQRHPAQRRAGGPGDARGDEPRRDRERSAA